MSLFSILPLLQSLQIHFNRASVLSRPSTRMMSANVGPSYGGCWLEIRDHHRGTQAHLNPGDGASQWFHEPFCC